MSLFLQDISFRYRSSPVLTNIRLEFGPMMTALIGPNGSGKSTLLKCMAGVLRPEGDIALDGHRVADMPRDWFFRQMSYLPQHGSPLLAITVLETVLLGMLHGLGLRVDDRQLEKAWETLEHLEIAHLAESRLGELSGGQQQLVAIAQTIVKDPRIILLDEPLNGLDIHHQLEMLQMVRHLTYTRGIITVVAMHDLNFAARYADSIVLLHKGSVYGRGTPAEVLTKETIREVYRVDAEVSIDAEGIPRMHFSHAGSSL